MPLRIKFVVSKESNYRLDRAIANYCKENNIELSRSALKSRDANILVNQRERKLSHIVKEGDVIELTIPDTKLINILPQDVHFEILYLDNDIAVVNKPSGLVVHPSKGHEENTLVNGLLNLLVERYGKSLSFAGGIERPGIVHRLDKDTAGILIIALSDKAHHKLSEDFKERRIKKTYYAVVKGYPEREGKIELPIGRSRNDRKKMAVVPEGRYALTEYRVIEYLKDHSLVEINLHTGRTHQIRVHFAHIGHPVAGDAIYSRNHRQYGLTGLALCAKKIIFNHPATGREMSFEIELPEEMKRLVTELRSG